MPISSWQSRLTLAGASPTEVVAIVASYNAATLQVQQALDAIIAAVATGDIATMLAAWRGGTGPFYGGFPGGGLPFGTHAGMLTGASADDTYAMSAGTGIKLAVGGGGGSLEVTDGTHTETGITVLTIAGGVVSTSGSGEATVTLSAASVGADGAGLAAAAQAAAEAASDAAGSAATAQAAAIAASQPRRVNTTPAYAATVTPAVTGGIDQLCTIGTLTGALTLGSPTVTGSLVNGQWIEFFITHDATGRVITFTTGSSGSYAFGTGIPQALVPSGTGAASINFVALFKWYAGISRWVLDAVNPGPFA